jgi:lipopolysaccharide transport system permease protein
MHAYLGTIWNCRFFWLSLVKMDLRSRYRGSVLGICWSLLHPIAMTTILCVVFKYAFNNTEMRTFAPLVFSGLTFWGFISASVVQGCGCFFQGESYIRQFPAPMAIYPLRNVLGAAFHFAIGLLLAIVIGVANGPDVRESFGNPSATRLDQLLALPSLLPTCLLLLLLGWSLSTLFGLLSVRFRDTRHLTEIALQGLFYLTPVMYRIDAFKNQHRLTMLLHCNPLVPFLDILREPILFGRFPSLANYAMAASVVLLVSLVAAIAMRIEERRLIFHL